MRAKLELQKKKLDGRKRKFPGAQSAIKKELE